MSSNNKTELILGVSHIPEFLRVTRDVLEAKFPGGLESLMLELPPWYANVPEEDIDRNEYFSRIKEPADFGFRKQSPQQLSSEYFSRLGKLAKLESGLESIQQLGS